MSRRFRALTFRKPAHWSKERYEEYLKENKLKAQQQKGDKTV